MGGALSGCGGELESCTVSFNKSGFGGCISSWEGTITNCSITRNEEGGVYWSSGEVRNSLIADNSGCPGLYVFDGDVINSTISRNGFPTDGGISSCDVTIVNSIVFANWGQNVHDSEHYEVEAYCSCIGGWSGEGNGNTSEDPLLVDPGAGD